MYALVVLGFERLWAGRWDEAEELLNEGVAQSIAHGYRILTWQGWYDELRAAGQTKAGPVQPSPKSKAHT